MAKEFKLQDPGEGIHEAEILEILVAEGDSVEEGDDLFRIETDKASLEIPASFNGVIEKINIERGEVARVGDVLLTYADEEEEAEPAQEAPAEAETESAETEAKPAASDKAREQPSSERAADAQRSDRPIPAAPATRRLARELGVELAAVKPSGPHGRVTAEDVRQAAEGGAEAKAEAEKPEKPEKPEAEAEAEQKAPRPAPERPAAAPLPDFTQWGEVEQVPLRSIRRTTAKRMLQSWTRIPHVTHGERADVTALERFRRAHEADLAEKGGKLTLTVLVLKAAVAALKEFPRFNASLDWENETLIIKHYFHIGVAVDTGQGLLVPVVRDVDRKSIYEIAQELSEIGDRARRGELEREAMQGGTFTITNPGFIGGEVFTPIVNYPEVAILGLGRAALEPAVRGDMDNCEIVAQLRLPLLLAFDHRAINGAEAARFVRRLVELLGDPDTLMLSS